MQLYWKVKIDGKWTFRKAMWHSKPSPFDFVYEILPYREEDYE